MLTPAELQALIHRWDEEQKRQDHRFGMIAATLANIHRDPKTHPFSPSEFFPGLKPAMTPEQKITALAEALGRPRKHKNK